MLAQNDSHLYCAAVVKTENQTFSLARLVPDLRGLYGNHASSMDHPIMFLEECGLCTVFGKVQISNILNVYCSRIPRLSPAP